MKWAVTVGGSAVALHLYVVIQAFHGLEKCVSGTEMAQEETEHSAADRKSTEDSPQQTICSRQPEVGSPQETARSRQPAAESLQQTSTPNNLTDCEIVRFQFDYNVSVDCSKSKMQKNANFPNVSPCWRPSWTFKSWRSVLQFPEVLA